MGRLTKDPEVRYTSEGQAIAKFTLAVDRRQKDQADFIPVTAFGKLAEFAEKYLTKGTKIFIEAAVQNNNYTSEDGVNHYGFSFIANNIEFCESKSKESKPTPASCGDGFMNIPEGIDEDLPFADPRR